MEQEANWTAMQQATQGVAEARAKEAGGWQVAAFLISATWAVVAIVWILHS